MVHRHSIEAAEKRKARARDGGLLRPRPRGIRYVEVPEHLVERIRHIVRSVALHDRHNEIAGQPAHYARDAARYAGLSSPCLAEALGSHRKANRAKHEWTEASKKDPLFAMDPWRSSQPRVVDETKHVLQNAPVHRSETRALDEAWDAFLLLEGMALATSAASGLPCAGAVLFPSPPRVAHRFCQTERLVFGKVPGRGCQAVAETQPNSTQVWLKAVAAETQTALEQFERPLADACTQSASTLWVRSHGSQTRRLATRTQRTQTLGETCGFSTLLFKPRIGPAGGQQVDKPAPLSRRAMSRLRELT